MIYISWDFRLDLVVCGNKWSGITGEPTKRSARKPPFLLDILKYLEINSIVTPNILFEILDIWLRPLH